MMMKAEMTKHKIEEHDRIVEVVEEEARELSTTVQSDSRSAAAAEIMSVKRAILSITRTYWKGLVPALLLCSNPAINYTVYDVIKSRVLQLLQLHHHKQQNTEDRIRLSMIQSFRVGLVAKLIATIITYPLIRAKVMMMTSKSMTTTTSSSLTLWEALRRCYYSGGGDNDGKVGNWRGLYKGCDYQILHTVCKSALMMMVRERISDHIHRFIVVVDDANQDDCDS